ncbi:methyltetrahydrofolate cobalamin methyltransferase [Sporomusa acidovorans]|uniref:5-methyltetrahydrofolate:corrinoid/iron-sulfur protein co-methyltransferase n=1 Tax=Sporomusa acidovorans (strain ATCC 49682 / DSM 3132 / Mol) TaxID=1123286 RepID=A0ABZ3IXJ5_SPOA4|nr:methyltetrahydrofolate cobalamin methyltransferase [Sporomusa acidovorans]OZC22396.1 5-methyltetrahydrofolate:corrinoid/iron-sulfur protein co-methyltransferase [Sporomusa acidovorans DSM 3132]SDE47955.1 5-methyltetrahydrofolate--homocysteine methyltransferase [Sporomusa acidovorans]
MIVVGELINSSRKAIAAAIEDKDAAAIQKVAKDQFAAGAHYIDVNAGIFVGKESEYLNWLVKTVQEVVDAPCCIDSPDPKCVEQALKIHRGTAMVNSISLERERYYSLLPVIAGTDLKVVALCMSDDGMPETTEARLKIADKLINNLTKQNIPLDNIYVDALVQPVATSDSFGIEFLDAIQVITANYPGVHTICGLSNISYGLPNRKFMNQMFAVMGIAKGLDGLIINPLDKAMMAGIVTAETLAGRDNFCCNYLEAYRQGGFSW